MMHRGVHSGESAGGQLRGMGCVELVSHTQQERALDDRDVLIGRMKMRRDLVAVRQVEPDREQRGLARVSLKHRHLCTGWENCRRGTPLDLWRLRHQGADGEYGE